MLMPRWRIGVQVRRRPFDRFAFLGAHYCVENTTLGDFLLQRALLIPAAVIAIAVLLISVMAVASGQWHAIGQTESGAKVSVSAVHSLKNHQRTALVRIQYPEPAQLPQGGPFVEMRAHVRLDCSNGSVSPSSEWFYTRERNGRSLVSKKVNQDLAFGQDPEGGFAALVTRSVCGQN